MTDIRKLLERAYQDGWCAAAHWAKREDLEADIDSPAYIEDRDGALDALGAEMDRPPYREVKSIPTDGDIEWWSWFDNMPAGVLGVTAYSPLANISTDAELEEYVQERIRIAAQPASGVPEVDDGGPYNGLEPLSAGVNVGPAPDITDEELGRRFTRCAYPGPNPMYRCNGCGHEEYGVRNLLLEHAAACGVAASDGKDKPKGDPHD